MKKLLLIGVLLGIISFTFAEKINLLESGLVIKDSNKIYYNFGSNIVTGADSKTFKKLDNNGFYWKDKNNIYAYLGENFSIIKNVDKTSFKVLSTSGVPAEGGGPMWAIAKDKNSVYNFGTIIKCQDGNREIKADVKTFKAYNGGNFLTDKNYVFGWFLKPLSYDKCIKIDSKTFKTIDNNYAKDKNKVYFKNIYQINVLEKADPNSFKVISYEDQGFGTPIYSKDKNIVFIDGKTIKGADSKSFIIVNNSNGEYSMDKNYVYINGEKIIGSNSKTFKLPKK